MPIYMKVDGIDGGVTETGHQHWIAIEAFNFALQRDIRLTPGVAKARESRIPVFQEMSILKKVDKSSPLLFAKACAGKAISTVTIDICQSGDGFKLYSQYVLENVIISGFDDSAGGTQVEAQEFLRLNYTKITKKYISRDAAHLEESPISSSYDLIQAKVV